MIPDNLQLNCLVLAKQAKHRTLVSSWLDKHLRVGNVTTVADEQNLRVHLSKSQVQLCIVVADNKARTLPAQVLHYIDVPVLVLGTGRKPTKIKAWFEQGASDVVSLRKAPAAQQAIKRLIDECVLKQQQRYLESHVQQLEQEVAYLKSILKDDKPISAPEAANETEHNVAAKVQAQLERMQRPLVENIIVNYKPRDITSGLTARLSVLKRLQQVLVSEVKAPRITAMLVIIFTDNNEHGDGRKMRKSREDLTLHRAANTLEQQLNSGTILGRINRNALLIIQSSIDEPASREAANKVRNTLGSLGGLINAQTDVHINTMNMPAKSSISANEIIERLEATT